MAQERAERYRNDANVHMELAVIYFERGEYDEAVVGFQKAQGSPRHRVRALLYKGISYAALENFNEAKRSLQRCLEDSKTKDADKLELYYELGKVYELEGDSDKAQDAFKSASEIDPEFKDLADKLS